MSYVLPFFSPIFLAKATGIVEVLTQVWNNGRK